MPAPLGKVIEYKYSPEFIQKIFPFKNCTNLVSFNNNFYIERDLGVGNFTLQDDFKKFQVTRK